MNWWNGEDFVLHNSFETDELTITVSGEKALEFASSGDPKEDTYRAACQISGIVLVPQVGGMTEMRFKLYVLPDLGKTNLLLQEHQHREVKLSWKDARVIEQERKQPELPMGQQGEAPATAAEALSSDTPQTH